MELNNPLTGSIKLRELQRDTRKVCGFLSTNEGNCLDVINGRGEVVYCVISKECLRQQGVNIEQDNNNVGDSSELLETLIEEIRELGGLIKSAIHN